MNQRTISKQTGTLTAHDEHGEPVEIEEHTDFVIVELAFGGSSEPSTNGTRRFRLGNSALRVQDEKTLVGPRGAKYTLVTPL